MPQFIYTGGKHTEFTEIGVIDRVRRKKGGRWELYSGDRIIDEGNASLDEALTMLVAVNGDWECLTPIKDEGRIEICVQPVLAWGLNVFGHAVPITPDEMHGVYGQYGLRRGTAGRVYVDGYIGGFADAEAWLAFLREHELP